MNEEQEGKGSEKTKTASARGGMREFLTRNSKVVSILIIAAVVAPSIFVAAQIAPVRRTLPAAKDFRMQATDGTTWIPLSSYLGRVVLIDFMATWCLTCKESMPDLASIYRNYSSNPAFVMLSVTASSDDTLSEMSQFKATYSANWTFAVPESFANIWRDYFFNDIPFPTYVLLDREGQIIYRSEGLTPLRTLSQQIGSALNS